MNDIANPLFRGVSDAEWKEMEEMNCLWETEYRKNKRICQMGNVIHELGVVTKGRVHIETVDPWGNKSILSEVGEGEVFAETYAFCEEPMMVEVSAAEDSNKYRKRLAGEDSEEYAADFAAEESDLIPAHFLYDAKDDQRACAYVSDGAVIESGR